MNFTELPWITPADKAGLQLLCREWTDGYLTHRDGLCAYCTPTPDYPAGRVCKPMQDALQAVLDWRDGRELYRRARALDQLEQPAKPALKVVA